MDNEMFVEQFLRELNLEEYLGTFLEYNIKEKDQIKSLDREILQEIGIKKIGDRLHILIKANRLKDTKKQNDVDQIQDLIKKFNSLSMAPHFVTDELVLDKSSVIFILNDGSAKKVNINGCFNADSIKKRLIKRLPPDLLGKSPEGDSIFDSKHYDVFIVDYTKSVLHLLYDVELVTICHSSDRLEKNRLIFVSKDQTPSEKAISVSKKLFFRTLGAINRLYPMNDNFPTHFGYNSNKFHDLDPSMRNLQYNSPDNLPIENGNNKIRTIFNQRPTSEYISTNLRGYFPQADMKSLEKTLKDAYRQSIRLSVSRGKVPNYETNNIGDILLKHSSAVDVALLNSLSDGSEARSIPNLVKKPSHCPVDENDMIKLVSSEATDDDEEDTGMVSLPTKISAPKAWLKGARIGSGSFGNVYLGMNANTGELMAVKQVALKPDMIKTSKESMHASPVKVTKETSDIHKKMVDALQHEMNLLKELHHENIVTYYGSSQENGNLNIFLEYVPGGSVSSMLNNYGPFEESLVINFTRQILIGVAYLHQKNIIHRDIKGANILIDIKGCVKITDFGISKKLSPINNPPNKRASLQGSVYWMAPEVVKQTATTEKVDIWSTGCVVVEMFTGNHPYPDFSQMQALFKIGTNTTPEIPSWANEGSQDFLNKAFELDYQKRPSAIELLQHFWLDTHIL
ncbi:hypothetical protein TBLA_0A08290 [Henningerozyma blattae CBS 6284]|uniref:Serine/threonine-protein kinase STE11 n=1 Tax=Henningerozyma blattae (strain ATCC 34711 / CBS 6284 / DSM 70876 / NBRC 10599 / NRRL Y-10934 / UCD 77-7) TaxID=1071380 RepID=I2GWW6_HENB6|nr:hypothetical protein TBLA_0A08290 [Tetrapisispora blattae CBS 6284]CCH58618.1 hypothetical protein TBLA_0A08290 [Tetrapisispora blattae CBS 6284]